MPINVEKLNAKLEEGEARKKQVARRAAGAVVPTNPPQVRPRLSSQHWPTFSGWDELLGSGCLVRLIVRDEGQSGASFTLKAVLEVPGNALYVYMHGYVKATADLPSTLDQVIRAGHWHEDRYPSKG